MWSDLLHILWMWRVHCIVMMLAIMMFCYKVLEYFCLLICHMIVFYNHFLAIQGLFDQVFHFTINTISFILDEQCICLSSFLEWNMYIITWQIDSQKCKNLGLKSCELLLNVNQWISPVCNSPGLPALMSHGRWISQSVSSAKCFIHMQQHLCNNTEYFLYTFVVHWCILWIG